MPSTYTTSLRLTLPANGELAGTWGTTVNAGVTSLAEASIAGTAAVAMIDADYTLSVANGSTDQARNMFVTLTGTLSAARNVICPAVSKLYFVTNNTTGGYAITFKTLAGTGISVPNGQRAVVYCNGTDVVGGLTSLDSLSLNGSLTLVGGTANTVPYLNGSKVVTTGAALAFDGANLSLGTAPSAWSASYKSYELPAGAVWSVSPTSLFLTSNAYNNGTNYIYKTSNAASQYQQGSGVHTWSVAASGTAGASFSFTTAMTLNASGNLGIGVSPTYKLDVYGTGSQTVAVRAATSGDARFYAECAGTNSGWMQYTRSLQALQWSANGATQHLTLDSSGNLGLGVTPSAWGGSGRAFDITSTGSFEAIGGNSTSFSYNRYFNGTSNIYKTTGFASIYSQNSSGQHAWYTAPSGTAGNPITFTTAMTLDASGNLGLKFTPSAWSSVNYSLQGAGGSFFSTGLDNVITANNVYFDGAYKYVGAYNATMAVQSAGQHAWLTAAVGTAGAAISFTTAMTLTASGNLGIGTASPASKLHVASGAIRLSDGYELGWGDNSAYIAGNGTTELLQFFTASSERMRIDSTGTTVSNLTINDGYTEEVFAVSGTTPALSPTNGSIQTWTLSGASTPTAGTWASGQSLTLMVDDGTAFTINWASVAVTWKTGGGTAPTLNTTGFTVIQLWKVGTTIYGARVGDA
jgi:hypothetical protein